MPSVRTRRWAEAGSGRQPVDFPLKPDDPFYTVEGIRASVPHFYEKTTSVQDLEGEMTFGGSFRKEKQE